MVRCAVFELLMVAGIIRALGETTWSNPADRSLGSRGWTLLKKLRDISASDAFVFGHHNSEMLGQKWSDDAGTLGKSDVVLATSGHWPGMVGYNLDWFVTGTRSNVDWEKHISDVKSKNMMLHVYWEASNPTTCTTSKAPWRCENAKDLTGEAITAILPGGKANHIWVEWMDQAASFFRLCDRHGVAAVFRPFHENTGAWFWWGVKAATAGQYRAAWNYTQDYLMHTKGVHNILYAYAPSKPKPVWDMAFGSGPSSTYPGHDRVDIPCWDQYGQDDFHEDLIETCDKVADFSAEHGKVTAMCEFGVSGGSQNGHRPNWFKEDVLDHIVGSQKCLHRLTFAYTWANFSPDNYWVPLPGQTLYPGFKAFFQSKHTIFAGDSRLTEGADGELVVV